MPSNNSLECVRYAHRAQARRKRGRGTIDPKVCLINEADIAVVEAKPTCAPRPSAGQGVC